MDKKDNRFMECFAGEEVEFILKVNFKTEDHSEEGSSIQENPLAVRGFVIDMDDENVYLGDTPDGITRFVRRDTLAGGEIVKTSDGFDELLTNFEGGSTN